MSEVDAVGEVVGGAIVAREADAIAGGADHRVGSDGHTHERACLNCGTPLTGAYCHECGQHGHIHRTLGAFFHDLLHSVFHVEGRLWRTLPLLAWRPGELTRRYIEGERMRFVSPMALFLFTVFLMFAVLGSFGTVKKVDVAEINRGIETSLRNDEARLAALRKERAAVVASGAATDDLDRRIAAVEDDVEVMRNVASRGVVRGGRVQINENLPDWIRDPIVKASRNPDLTFYKLRTNAYKWSWALIPLSVPFLWLLFPFSRRFRLYDHMVFVTYSLSFMNLLVITAGLLSAAGLTGAIAAAMFVPPVHMYRQLKGAYGLGRLGALWRTVLLTMFAFTAASLFVAMIVGIGLSG